MTPGLSGGEKADRGLPIGFATRAAPIAFVVVGLTLTVGFARAWRGDLSGATAPWWAYLFLMLLAVAMLALAAALVIDPRPMPLRQALGGAALVWLVVLVIIAIGATGLARSRGDGWLLVVLVAVIGGALVDLAVTTPSVVDAGSSGPPAAMARLGAVILFALAIFMATGAAVIFVSLARAIWRSATRGEAIDRLPWGLVIAILVLPLVTFTIAAVGTRRASGGTFYAQAAANRRNSILLLITMIGIVAATAEVIAVTLTFEPVPALWSGVVAAVIGLAAAAGANRFGGDFILQTAGALPADPTADAQLIDVVAELALAANIPMPRVYVIADGSQNAFATGRDPRHASVAVTRGLLRAMDREELQGVIGHELGHIRNFDTRYALYVAVLVGLVALATDGFLQLVIQGWKSGAFTSAGEGDSDGAAAGLAMGILIGIFLFVVASLLRVVTPFFAALVQASTSREREFLADATSVEFTRNPRALERALASIAADTDTLDAANRGTQHLWFRNPVKPGSDRRSGLLATHPSLQARIGRLQVLQGLPPSDIEITGIRFEET
ncbi:MAG: M48 family metallopeptidase [Chloroflexota bacterium]